MAFATWKVLHSCLTFLLKTQKFEKFDFFFVVVGGVGVRFRRSRDRN